MKLRDAETDRFWSKVEIDNTSGCWLWRGTIHERGYPQFYLRGINKRAHRVSYETAKGPIPDGLTLDHLCRTPACVNPDHLEPVTLRENIRRAKAQITHCPHGHPYSGANLIVRPNGQRDCRECKRERNRKYRTGESRRRGQDALAPEAVGP